MENPSEEYIRFFTNKMYNGRNTEKILEYFNGIIKKSHLELLQENFNDRINKVIVKNEVDLQLEDEEKKNVLVTTELEIESYYIIKSLLRSVVEDIDRLKYKDTVNYFNVFLDSTRNTICRLYLNGVKKYIVFLDENKKESIKKELMEISDIYKYETMFTDRIKQFIKG
jgi:hypothetical protein